jgi:hypothetical protein
MALALAFSAAPVQAQDECGVAAGIPLSANCTGAGNPYATGITYDAGIAAMVLNIDGTVSVVRPDGFNARVSNSMATEPRAPS